MMSVPDGSSPDFAPDQIAAHQFLAELRTRISTQPLAYQHGVDARALESMWEVFGHARDAIRENPGCREFARRTTEVLNLTVRPLTAKWHRAFESGRLLGRDGADEFRCELQKVRATLREFAAELHLMAYGEAHKDGLTPEVMTKEEIAKLFQPLAFGFIAPAEAMEEIAADIANDEAEAVHNRREWVFRHPAAVSPQKGEKVAAPDDHHDAVGLALSGGGIRSATFSLGVVQVLAEEGFLRQVDFLSTVSGGGYTGCFLTRRLGNGEPLSDVAGSNGPDPEPVRHLRQHAKFLFAGTLKEKWEMVAAALAGMLLNWAPPTLVILLLALVAHWVGKRYVIHWNGVLLICSAACVAGMVAYGGCLRLGGTATRVSGRIFGIVLATTSLIGLGRALETLFPRLLESISANEGVSSGIAASLAVFAALTPGIIRFLPVFENPGLRRLVLKAALWLAGVLVPLIAMLLFYSFRALAADHFSVLIWIAVGTAVVSFLLNINLTAPHRLYRDGLARTFIQYADSYSPDTKLEAINPKGTAPYHLINAALNIPGSTDPALRDRACDFFSFSKHWIGSPAVGYARTSEWKTNGTDVDLATAMAVSGAAFSSYMGLGSKPALTALLTLLNVRLGFWIKRPAFGGSEAPGFGCLLREMTGIGMTEEARWLNLSDGGHIENLGIYELLRRRCKFLICVDGEADPTFTFHGLMTLVRHAQIDFGVRIDAKLEDLRPDPETKASKCHFHLCRIHYPAISNSKNSAPAGVGLLLYVKLSVTGNESELIKRYRASHPEFPHQTTLDQFFDQEQFEAYRQLGAHVARGLFLPALMDDTKPRSVPEWFRQLAKNLLEPIKI